MGIITHSCARARDALATLLRHRPMRRRRPTFSTPDVFAEAERRAPRLAGAMRMYCAERHAGMQPLGDADNEWFEEVWEDLARDLDAGLIVALFPDGTDQPATFVWASQVPGARGPVTS